MPRELIPLNDDTTSIAAISNFPLLTSRAPTHYPHVPASAISVRCPTAEMSRGGPSGGASAGRSTTVGESVDENAGVALRACTSDILRRGSPVRE